MRRPHRLITKTLLVMKLTTFLLLSAALQVSARGYGQQVTLSVKRAPLDKVLDLIRRQTGTTFFYNDAVLEKSHPVTLDVAKADLATVLELCLRDQPLTYERVGPNILIKEKQAPQQPAADSSQAAPPPVDVHGRIVDEKGNPLEGVSISIKGRKKGTMTDKDGDFELDGVPADGTVVISSVGYQTQEVSVKYRTEFTIRLKLSAQALPDMEVTVSNGIFQLPKERATGSYDYIDNSLLNRSVSTDILSRLNGVASGVLFDNTAGNNLNMQIRGMSTIQSNTQPLIVLNDMAYDGNVEDINPNDIESITVLKDAAAASIWGVRAGNGVVVITTKKGHYNEPLKINFNTNLTVTSKPNLFYDPNFLDASDFINVETALYNSGYYAGQLTDPSNPPISPVVSLLDSVSNGLVTSSYANNLINSYCNLDYRNDLKKYFYRGQANQQYSLSFSGGTEKANFLVSGGYDKNMAIQVGNSYQRITLNTLNNFIPFKGFVITAGLNYNNGYTTQDNTLPQMITGGSYGLLNMYPYEQLADAKGNALPMLRDFSTNFVTNIAPALGFQNWQYFPLDELRNHYNTTTTKEDDIRANIGLRYNLTGEIAVEGKYSYESTNTNGLNDATGQSYANRSLINLFSTQDPNTGMVTGYNIPLGDMLSYNFNSLVAQDFRTQLSFNRKWNIHSLTFIGGFEVRDVTGKQNSYDVYGYNPSSSTFGLVDYVDAFYNNYGGGNIPSGISNLETINRYKSYFSNIGYTLLGKYTFSASGRIDQSNLFGVNTNQKTLPLWSAGLKWDLDKEAFYKLDFLSLLKLRLTYGYSGNINNNIYAYPTANYSTSGTPYGTVTLAQLISPGDPDLTWEKSGILNAGVDFGMAKNRVYGSFDYYRRKGTNLIGTEPIQASAGVNNVIGNYSDMSGNGFDLKLDASIVTGALKWNAELLTSYTVNKVTRYLGTPEGTNFNVVVGKPVSGLYGLKWAGLDPTNGDPRGYLGDSISKDYAAITAQPIANPADNKLSSGSGWVYKGSAQPTFFGGFRNTFSYKNVSLSFNITYKMGYSFTRSSINYYALFTEWKGNRDFTKRWQNPGDEKKTNVPSMPDLSNIDNTRDGFYSKSEALIDNGGQIRFQDINLSYDLKGQILKRTQFVKSMVIYSYINNVGLLWRANKDHLDPDFPTGIPTARSYSFGVKMGF